MKYILNIVLLLCNLNSFAQIIEVKQDGTGDFSIIQEAMDFAQQNDTVLVWPGTYFENLDFNGKSLTLASLMLTTGDEDYKFNTIIDGGQNGSCIVVENIQNEIIIDGVTVQNGKADAGGGISIFNSIAVVRNCIIKNNKTKRGGGGIICYESSELFISKNSIFKNHTYGNGGGMLLSVDSYVQFDSINRNSIYTNFAERGCDFQKSTNYFGLNIYLDTCTVLEPDSYFMHSSDNMGYFKNDLVLNVQNSIMSPHDGNIYVNPQTGDNNNSGTSWDEPLKSIAWAYSKIQVDSLDKNTIRLANGIYSDTTNNENFPLNIRPFIDVIGESRDGVILDGNKNIYVLKGNNNITDYSFQRMTIQGGPIPTYSGFGEVIRLVHLYTGNDRFLLDSIVFKDSYANGAFAILAYYQADSSVVRNCVIKDNIGGHGLRTVLSSGKKQFINNCIITNQQPDFDNPFSTAGNSLTDGDGGTTIVQNCLFHNNPKYGISRITFGDSYLINCTFVDNSELPSSSAIGVYDARMHLYNCISYNQYEVPIAISVLEPQKQFVSHLDIYNSLIEGSQESVVVSSSCQGDIWCKVHYDSTNIDADPNFLGMWGHPYMIADGSPCIDAGTLANLPDFIELPEFDLAGNPRIVGDSIDMGAYEWNPTIVGFNEIGPGNREESRELGTKLLKVSPNPFDWGTYLSVELESRLLSGEVKVEIYDNYGILVRNILTTTLAQDQKILWYGDDNNGNPLSAGVYYIVMFSGEREVESLKVVKR